MSKLSIDNPEKILKRVIAITANYNKENSRLKLMNLIKLFDSLVRKNPKLIKKVIQRRNQQIIPRS